MKINFFHYFPAKKRYIFSKMRNTLIELLINRIKKDYFLTADLGFSVLEKIN